MLLVVFVAKILNFLFKFYILSPESFTIFSELYYLNFLRLNLRLQHVGQYNRVGGHGIVVRATIYMSVMCVLIWSRCRLEVS